MKSTGVEFILNTRLPNPAPSDQSKGLAQPPLTLPADESWPQCDLPQPAKIAVPPCDLRAAVEGRRSLRDYAATPLSLGELSYLLWCTQGVQEVVTDRSVTLRPVPSAGARHPFETYLLVNRVAGLTPGLYRFLAVEHRLAAINCEAGVADDLYAACMAQEHVRTCAVMFLWAAVARRTVYRYGERGYRYILLDAGHVCQNLYLAAQSIGCGVCAIGAFHDADLNALLGLDGEQHFVVYSATLGKR